MVSINGFNDAGVWKSLARPFRSRKVVSRSQYISISPHHESAQNHGTAPEFDVLHYYCGDCIPCSISKSLDVKRDPEEIQQQAAHPSPYLSLVSLSAAQGRDDIRRRVEGFEMDATSRSALTVISTQIGTGGQTATVNNEIRREEGAIWVRKRMYIEIPSSKIIVEAPPPPQASGILDSDLSPAASVPSIYSEESWYGDRNQITSLDHFPPSLPLAICNTIVKPVDVNHLQSDNHRHPMDLSTSSIDEESFLRMAVSLGW